MNIKSIKEMKALQAELMGKQSFVEPDFANDKWVRLNELTGRYQRFLYQLNHAAPLQTLNQIINN